MKKISIFLSLLLVFSMLAAPASAIQPEDVILSSATHTHQLSQEWVSNESEHWRRCQVAGCSYVENRGAHTFENSCDPQCDTCGYIRFGVSHTYDQQWYHNEEVHWRYCVHCDQRSQETPHVPGPAATQTTPQICELCGFLLQLPLGHIHNYEIVWNDQQHWQKCTDAHCNAITPAEAHRWMAGTATESGEIRYYCTICGTFSATVDQITPGTSIGTQPKTENSGNWLEEIVDAGGGLLIGGGVLALLLILLLCIIIPVIIIPVLIFSRRKKKK